jgi:ATP-binding cassette subfamily B protein
MMTAQFRLTRLRVPFVPQMEVPECGAACLTMILGFYGRNVPLAEMRSECGVSRDGVSALALVRAATVHGLDAAGVRLEPQDLRALRLPAILHWELDHFVVLERVGRRSFTIVDPAIGRRRVSATEVARLFTGVALVFEPTPRLCRRRRARPSFDNYADVLRKSALR